MFDVGYFEILAGAGAVLLGVLLWRTGATAGWVRVDDTHVVAVRPEALEAPFTRLLSSLPRTQLRMGGPSTWTLTVRRSAWWTIFPAVLMFPLGLLFLLFREEGDLLVTVRPASDGAELRLVGTTRRATVRALRAAAEDLPRVATAAVTVAHPG